MSKVLLSDDTELAIPSAVSRSGESLSIEVDPNILLHSDNKSLHGYIMTLKPSLEEQGIRTKGTFNILHYQGVKRPRQQEVEFDFVSTSGQTIAIPIQYGFIERRRNVIVGSDGQGKDFKRIYYTETKPQTANLEFRVLTIDSAGQPLGEQVAAPNLDPLRSRHSNKL